MFFRLAAVLILLLGFGLRVYLLDGQSMWSDEGLSLYRARQTLSDVLQNTIIVDGVVTQDTNPPFYFLLLSGWRSLTGERLWALRYQGVLTSMAAIAITLPWALLIARGRTGRRVALLMGFFMTLSPFNVWETQNLRNYPLLLALNLLSVYAIFRFILRPQDERRQRWLLVWLGASLLGIYTHYFAFFVFAWGAGSLFVYALVMWAGRRDWRRVSWKLLALPVLGLLLLLPALPTALERFAAGPQFDFHRLPPQVIATHAASAFGVGISPSLSHPWLLWLPAVLLAAAGLALAWRMSRAAALLLLGYLAVPLGLLVMLSTINPLYNGTRHLLIGLPPFLMLIAIGTGGWLRTHPEAPARRLARYTCGLIALAVVLIQVRQLHAQFHDPRFIRDDVRGAAAYLSEVAAPDDVVVLHDTLIRFVFDYYYQGDAPVVAIPEYGQQDTFAAARQLLDSRVPGRIWFLTLPAPRTGFDREWLPRVAQDAWAEVYAHQFHHLWLPVRLEGYVTDVTLDELPPVAHPLGIELDGGVRLEGYDLPEAVRAGSPWWARFFLTAPRDPSASYTLSLRLVDEMGDAWAQSDQAILPNFPTERWPSDELLRSDHEFTLPVGLPPGAYTVRLRILDDSGAPLHLLDGGSEASLGSMIVSASQEAGEMAGFTSQRARFGPIDLLGYRLPTTDLRPGHQLAMDVIWQARRAPGADYQVKLELLDEEGTVLEETLSPLTRPGHPTSQWRRDDVIQGQYVLEIPALATDSTTVRLTVVDMAGSAVGRSIELDETPPIRPWPLVTDMPVAPRPLAAIFGNSPAADEPLVSLHGFDAPLTASSGDGVQLTLFWQSLVNMDGNLIVLVHLTDEAGQIVAQADGVPVNGTRLTTSWRTGEVLVDEHEIQLPPDLPPGAYQLWTGFYDAESGARLAARSGNEVWPDGRLPLARLTVQESP